MAEAVVVVGFRSLDSSTFLIRPRLRGSYVFVLWPKHDPESFRWSKKLTFSQDVPMPANGKKVPFEVLEVGGCPPQQISFSVPDAPTALRNNDVWSWALVPISSRATENLTRQEFDDILHSRNLPIASGSVRIFRPESIKHDIKRIVFWSCHQPYRTKGNGKSDLGRHTLNILRWYENKVEHFDPLLVLAMGDTAYADGTPSLDFVNKYYHDRHHWHNKPLLQNEIKEHFRRMYLYHWSFPQMQRIMRRYPHMLVWDDHEIRDGWGSHNHDYSDANHLATFIAAREIASEFVFSNGPRLDDKPESDSHMGFLLGSIAVFAFDTRSSRNCAQSRLLSAEQMNTFSKFLTERVAPNPTIRSVLVSTSTPIAYLIPSTENFASRFFTSLRDDIRDEWSTPNNKSTLEWLINELGNLQKVRPDMNLVNLTGSVHVSNAFELHPRGLKNPLFQISSSSLTNREHLTKAGRRVLTLGKVTKFDDVRGVGYRLWPDSGKPNILCIEASEDAIRFTLKSYKVKHHRYIVLHNGRVVDMRVK